MIRSIFAVIGAILTWFVVATIYNWLLRAGLSGYSAVEKSMDFSLVMLLCRLGLGLVSSFCSGAACAAIASPRSRAATAAAIVLLLLFLPVHYMLLNKFPIWYHLFFLVTLPIFVLLGAMTYRKLCPGKL